VVLMGMPIMRQKFESQHASAPRPSRLRIWSTMSFQLLLSGNGFCPFRLPYAYGLACHVNLLRAVLNVSSEPYSANFGAATLGCMV